jgi:hypothetical protein
MTYKLFLQLIHNRFNSASNNSTIRHGQHVMNILSEVWPDKYRELTSTDLDCFYNDNKIDTTLSYLEKVWDHEPNK